ncbi:type II toxin-antitoxin system death-on-curing family toxin [Nitratireductor kimnyeongensis]|uniref:Type II toxin-antitoxin system death-on-curing family toxin n=1 Tax=Nitratireductor kimnyeongensis TaxID=430679 RepID=A0ABW0T4W0_9HYPH|nr:type II toxin-antitoxin system death-on-curing family toxin [Nitratireductor kimnyeongensis]QZZ34972.1 type II toxin-antitoxin system death-on-curing family toxin [Nitratireductor kimnyeongensis]
MRWTFLSRLAVEAVHEEQLRRHGGARGVRDENAFESALARAENKALYETPDVHALAAAHAFGLARNHAFVDGNKRTAIVAAGTFLLLHGYRMIANDGLLYTFVMDLAAGEIDEEGAARFFRDHTVPLDT